MPDNEKIRIRPIIAVLCDEIRQEQNNKPFIIGIYTGGITLELPLEEGRIASNMKLPIAIPRPVLVSLWVPFEITSAGKVTVEFELSGPDIGHKVAIKAQVEYKEKPNPNELTAFSFSGLPLSAKESGDLKILFKHEDENEWQTLRVIPVTVKKATLPTEIELPSQQ